MDRGTTSQGDLAIGTRVSWHGTVGHISDILVPNAKYTFIMDGTDVPLLVWRSEISVLDEDDTCSCGDPGDCNDCGK